MIDHLSYSSISMYLDCPEAWRRKYIEKEPSVSSPALAFGSAFHDTLEQIVTNPEANVLETWTASWDKALTKEEVFWGVDTPEQHFNEGLRILGSKTVKFVTLLS